MNKKIPYLYLSMVLLCFVFLLYIGITFSAYKYTTSADLPTFPLNNLMNKSTDPYIQDLHITLPSVLANGTSLGFFTMHQNVEVLINDTLIYSYMVGNNDFGHTPGFAWHYIRLPSNSAGQELRVYLDSPYIIQTNTIPDFQLGSPLSLFIQLLEKQLLSFALCILTIIIGFILIFYWLNLHRSSAEIDNSLFFLGLFAITHGLFTLSQSQIWIFVFHYHILTSYLSYTLLMLIPLPFLLFIRNLYHNKDSILWLFLSILSIINIFLCAILQIFNIADLQQTLWITYLVMVLCIFSAFTFTIIEICKYSFDELLKLNMMCTGFFILGIIANYIDFYIDSYSGSALSHITFLVYIIIPAFAAIENISRLLKSGKEAELYRKMAYYDLLTKLHNRNAYVEALTQIRSSKEYPFIIICDLNNLKKCNDIFGHEYGDNYVQDASAIIRKTFSSLGKCYRIGGDEFCVLVDISLKNTALNLLLHINDEWSIYHDLPKSFEPNIAYGYASFDPILDHTFDNTIKRADSMMYVHKKLHKKKSDRSY